MITLPDKAPAATGGALCPYCEDPLQPVARGWHCPACHATLGEPEPATR